MDSIFQFSALEKLGLQVDVMIHDVNKKYFKNKLRMKL